MNLLLKMIKQIIKFISLFILGFLIAFLSAVIPIPGIELITPPCSNTQRGLPFAFSGFYSSDFTSPCEFIESVVLSRWALILLNTIFWIAALYLIIYLKKRCQLKKV